MEKQWRISEQLNIQVTGDLQTQLNVDRVVAQLLKQRQINTYSEAKSFFYSTSLSFRSVYVSLNNGSNRILNYSFSFT